MTIGIGILGFAHGHVNGYCTRWNEHPEWGVKPLAGWDHDEARIEAAVSQHGLKKMDSVEALLARDDIHAVVVSSETSYHADLVEQAAAAGKTIIIQKPLALTLAEADRIIAAIEKYHVRCTLAWQMRVDPQNIKIRELIHSGEFGNLFYIRRRHGLAIHAWPGFENTWHASPTLNRDIWADDASHPIDMIYWLVGEPETVTAELTTLSNPKTPNDNGVAVFKYADGSIVEVVCSFSCLGTENTTEVFAEKGCIVQNYGDGVSVATPRPKETDSLKWLLRDEAGQSIWNFSGIPSPEGHFERIMALAEPLAAFIRNERDPIATVYEGRASLKMVLACYHSSREGRRIQLKNVPDLPIEL